MKLLHLSDIHLGMENYGRIDPATGLSTRLADFCATFDEAIDRAIGEPVDVVLFAGDAYKTRDPTPTYQREFARRIRRLAEAGIPTVILAGNHDLPNAVARASATEIFGVLGLPQVYVSRRVETLRVETRHGPLQVVTLPWVTRSGVLAREEHRGRSLQELNALLETRIAEYVATEVTQLEAGVPAVLLGHCHLFGAEVGAERWLAVGDDPMVARSVLRHPQLAYVALGHLHRHQRFPDDPPIAYSGSINRVDFSEEEEEKGFILVELRPDGAVPQFVPVQARPFHTIEVTPTDDNPTEAVLRTIRRREHRVRDAVVRVIVHLTPEQDARFDEHAVRRALDGAFFVAPIQRRVEQRRRERLPGLLSGPLTPLDALRRYFEATDVPPARRDVLLEHAERLLQGEPVPSDDR